MTDTALKQIDKVVKENDVVLFMKGTPDFPQCGFSQRVAGILNEYGLPYAAVNVLLSDAVREGIKVYSDWPTIPQLYIKAEFVGGCDIISEMHASGELKDLLAPLSKDA
ncbi:MAG: Grx4 family monothiol glutaredoxin [Mariprofundus sp.]